MSTFARSHTATFAEDAPVLSVPDVVRLEQTIAQQGTSLATLMDRAGAALAQAVAEGMAKQNAADGSIAILCGYGNNGGDGWVAARILADEGFRLTLITPVEPQALKAQPARDAALACQPLLDACERARILVAPDDQTLQAACLEADAIVDAILGTGFSGDAVRSPFDAWILCANAQRKRGARIIAVDVPSGLSAQTGKAATPCMKADETVSMICLKPGLVTPYAFAFCGDVRVAPLAPIEHILKEWEGEASEGAQEKAPEKQNGRPGVSAKTAVRKDEFHRPEAEDDDGYDPYSDRRPEPEPLFQSDPWN